MHYRHHTRQHTRQCTRRCTRQRTLTSAMLFIIAISAFAIAGAANAFIGSIAVGLGRMNDVGEVKVSFAADATLETEEMTVDTRVYYKPGAVRDEMKLGGQEMVTIRRFDLMKLWILMGRGMYMEHVIDDDDAGAAQSPDYKLISREKVGSETVNGIKTTKYKSIYESSDGKFGGFTWYTDDNIAVKGFLVHQSQGEKRRVKFEFTKLERGPQPDTLFEIPKGAQKLDMGGFGMPAGGMGGMGRRPSGMGMP